MTFAVPSVPYPDAADRAPILRLASDLCRVAQQIGDAGRQIDEVRRHTESMWSGRAASAFRQHMSERSHRLQEGSSAIHQASPALERFAHTMSATEEAHRRATWMRAAAIAAGPSSISHQHVAVHEQQAAVQGLDRAGAECARRLDEVRRRLAGDDDGRGRSNQDVEPWRRFLSDAGDVIGTAAWWAGVFGGSVDGLVSGLRTAVDRFSTTVGSRGFRRWLPNRGGPSTGLTAGQAASRAQAISRWTRWAPVAGAALSGGVQTLQDMDDTSLSDQQRVRRAVGATVIEGGASWALAAGGAKGGALIGAAIGGPPGALIGGVVGGVGGAIAGSEVGRRIKELVFEWNPSGWFR